MKQTSEFHIHRNRSDGLASQCKECRNKDRREKYHSITKADEQAYFHKMRRHKPEMRLLSHAKARAKKRGLEFNLTYDDVRVPEKCPILGIALSIGDGVYHDASPTVDRVDVNYGYISNNVAVISHRANRIKNDASLAELERIVEWLKSR